MRSFPPSRALPLSRLGFNKSWQDLQAPADHAILQHILTQKVQYMETQYFLLTQPGILIFKMVSFTPPSLWPMWLLGSSRVILFIFWRAAGALVIRTSIHLSVRGWIGVNVIEMLCAVTGGVSLGVALP